MSRKSLILCLSVLAAMVVGVGVAVAILYSGVESSSRETAADVDSRFALLAAVPSDAVLAACFRDSEESVDKVFAAASFPDSLSAAIDAGRLRSGGMAVSLHYSGKLIPLYVFDVGRASSDMSESASALLEIACACGMTAEYVDCSSSKVEGGLSGRSVIITSPSETLVRSSLRHLGRGVSLLDASGFIDASKVVRGADAVFVSNAHYGKVIAALMDGKYQKYADFFTRLADWTALDFSRSDQEGIRLEGREVYDADAADFMTVLEKSVPASSAVSSVLPSYTMFVLSLPMKGYEAYADAYMNYTDARQGLQKLHARQKSLADTAGVAPDKFFRHLDIREVAVASFPVKGKLESVNLMKVGNADAEMIFKGTDVSSFKDYSPGIHPFRYYGFAGSVFGNLFTPEDETCFTWVDGWIVSGSRAAVGEYVSGKALEYSLAEYLDDVFHKDLLAGKALSAISYFSFTADRSQLPAIFKSGFLDVFDGFAGDADCCPVVMSVVPGKSGPEVSLELHKGVMKKVRTTSFVRDTVVVIPKGPFRVKNSGTGRMNLFYQQANMYLCLKEETGKGLWGVPFDKPICGTAVTVDYFANGKLQILFGAGSKLHLIDRLGRFVSGFPVELKKDILLGPDVYDFNGARRYNVMVLHKDNTIEMYNLKGQTPASWKSITAKETIKELPERILVGGNTFWVVRTSIQTLIFPFEGGTPLTVFEGDKMIRPDSEVKILDATSVEVSCYDGKLRTVKLKEK